MNKDMLFANYKIGIIGAGAMGRGIAQIAVLSGVKVLLFDTAEKAADDACFFITDMIGRLADKKKISLEKASAAIKQLGTVSDIKAMEQCDLVIEAIVEKLDIKQQLMISLEEIVPEKCILATNTSSLSVTSIASVCKNQERIAGFHFFNPVPLMKVVEVVKGVNTSDDVCSHLAMLAEHMGHTPVRTKDTPGFIVNHAGRAYGTESTSILEEGVADIYQIDSVLREGAGFRMGPFELYDLTALDVSHPATEAIFEQFYNEPRYRPSYILRQRLSAKLLGKKTGGGFYSYSPDKIVPKEPVKKYEQPDMTVWISRENSDGFNKVLELLRKTKVNHDDRVRPSAESLCIVTPLGQDATTSALKQDLDPKRTVAVDTSIGFDKIRTVMSTPATHKRYKEAAMGLFSADGVQAELINDSNGFITQRVLAMIVNIGCFIAQNRIAEPDDIDTAVKLGLGYPYGPLKFGDVFGAERVLDILTAIYANTGDPRYRPSVWLKRRVKLGLSLLHAE